jgi:hypothetical protein
VIFLAKLSYIFGFEEIDTGNIGGRDFAKNAGIPLEITVGDLAHLAA